MFQYNILSKFVAFSRNRRNTDRGTEKSEKAMKDTSEVQEMTVNIRPSATGYENVHTYDTIDDCTPSTYDAVADVAMTGIKTEPATAAVYENVNK